MLNQSAKWVDVRRGAVLRWVGLGLVIVLTLTAGAQGAPIPLIEIDFNAADGNSSLVNRGSIAVTGTFSGNAAYSTADGPYNTAGYGAVFDGNSDYVSFANASVGAALNGMTQFTITAWVYLTNDAQDRRIVTKVNGNPGFEFMIKNNDNAKLMVDNTAVDADVNISLNTWMFVAVTYDGTQHGAGMPNNVVFYSGTALNDTLFTGATKKIDKQAVDTNTGDLRIGMNDTDTAKAWQGGLDNIRIYNSILTTTDLIAIKDFSDGTALSSATINLGASVAHSNILKGGSTGVTATLSSATGSNLDAVNWSVNNGGTAGLVLAGSGTNLAAGTSAPGVNGTFTGSDYGDVTVTAGAAATNVVLGTGANGSPAAQGVVITVGNATAGTGAFDGTGNHTLYADVAPGGSMAGLASRTVNSLSTEAIILAGTNAGGSTVGMNWRTRTPDEIFDGVNPVAPQGVLGGKNGLVSDVVEVGGTGSNIYVLSMTYNPADLWIPTGYTADTLAENGYIFLARSDSSGWGQAAGGAFTLGAFEDTNLDGLGNDLGRWGVDPATHTAWAVVDTGGVFAVIPEPATLTLTILGGLAYFLFPKRK
ncbi:MAG: LamG domain-containing protein [Planctomycetaceae bacterium]|nr:LamG domain-containing protein [Planctomycetaceae bacterium]